MSEKGSVKSSRWKINKRFYVILICFFISAVFWILIALSQVYPASVVYPVNYVNLPGKKVVMNDLPTHIAVNVRATGFKILSYGFSKVKESVEVDVAANMNTSSVSNDFLALPTRSFVNDFAKELGKEVEITGFK